MSLKKWLIDWIYPDLVQKDLSIEAATRWKSVPPCRLCQRPLLVESEFCYHCGCAQHEKHTTAQHKLVQSKADLSAGPPSITDFIGFAGWHPDAPDAKRLIDIYNHDIKPIKYGSDEPL